ncbi:MAG: hypothetical protein GY794_02190 [bacterium]|nr:hypothetical protein [bacterium]
MLSKLRTFLLILMAVAFTTGCSMSNDYFSPKEQTQPVQRSVAGVMILYREAMAMVDRLEYAEATVKLKQVVDLFETAQDIPHTSESMFWLGFCREKLHYDDLAKQTYIMVIQRFGKSKPAQYARQRLDAMNRLQ